MGVSVRFSTLPAELQATMTLQGKSELKCVVFYFALHFCLISSSCFLLFNVRKFVVHWITTRNEECRNNISQIRLGCHVIPARSKKTLTSQRVSTLLSPGMLILIIWCNGLLVHTRDRGPPSGILSLPTYLLPPVWQEQRSAIQPLVCPWSLETKSQAS